MTSVGSALNHWVALLVPAGVIAAAGIYRKSLVIIHHGAITVCAAR